MAQQVNAREAAMEGATPARLVVEWASEVNEEGGPMRWFGSWLVGAEGAEGEWFYSGYGGERTEHPVPPHAAGVRIRRWTSEGLNPEYADLPLDGREHIRTAELDFNTPQPHRLLAV